ncbi:protein DpdE [Saccharothrix obliqua]|uniref:protein DpdE n=1 Tax=Saccharothrix obliqua TaxID=2861747 RepID=UPI001C5E6D53|nr:protein DpdE [Saccharothrix obliqua]MBW4717516.1 hypothetical protein [Saccharothrix obliqua]
MDRELGWGRLDSGGELVRFFDSPTTPEVVLPAAGRQYRLSVLAAQERVWWFDGGRWLVGRVSSPRTARADDYVVDFPNGRSEVVPADEVRVRWSLPLADPLALLRAGTVETRYFHSRRTAFLRAVTDQRSASRRLGGLLSSAVELHDHQIGAARRVLSDPVPRYLLADEVGLGKTIEAGLVIRQFLLDGPGAVLVVVPDQLVGQWRAELALKFRVDAFPRRVEVVGHSSVRDVAPESRALTVVDEAHRFTDNVDYGRQDDRQERYEALRAIAHASEALLLLSATPVRSNEDAFLGLLHLLDPENYSLSDVAGFRRRVEMRDDLAEAMAALDADTPIRYLRSPLDRVATLLPDDRVVQDVVARVGDLISAGRAAEARGQVERLRIHVSEAYRLHRRMIRNRRATAIKSYFPVRGRALAQSWRIADPDCRRPALFTILEELRFELEMAGTPLAGRVLQAVIGRALAPLTALGDLVVALRGGDDHDLSPGEIAAVVELRTAGLAAHLADQVTRLMDTESSQSRMSAAVEWARARVGRGKHVIACSYPNTARAMAELAARELGRHRVSALLEGQSEEERARLAVAFAQSGEKSVLVIDRSAEEGANLQFVSEVLHLDIPTSTSRLEQRLGRFDRWSELGEPVKSVVFREVDPELEEQFGAWTATLHDVFGAFTASTSTLQYVLADLEAEFFDTAVHRGPGAAREALAARSGTLDEQRRKIAGQDLLDSIEDRAEDEELTNRLAAIDARRREVEAAIVAYVHEMLHFTVDYDDDLIRFGVSRKKPPLLTEAAVEQIGPRVFKRAYTADRITAGDGHGFLRWGEPLVDAFADFAERDDRGRAFAVELEQRADTWDREPVVAFCFDVKVAPGLVEEGDEAFTRAVRARATRFLPTTIERVWWTGRGPCTDAMVKLLEREQGINLGSRPERFHELIAPFDWARACREAFEGAVAHVRARPDVVRGLAGARERATAAQAHEDIILATRSLGRADVLGADSRLVDALDHSLANPSFTLESCGAVFITWAGPE